MGKKIDDPEIKKECPSCGLGVAMDATVCEFCGWDFDEEDEWILQIEKLERDLMLEKQKFAPGSVNSKIESTLHTPAGVKAEMMKAAPKPVQKPAQKEPLAPAPQPAKPVPQGRTQPAPTKPVVREAARPAPTRQPNPATQPVVDRVGQPTYRQAPREAPQPIPQRTATPVSPARPSPPVRSAQEPAPPAEGPEKVRKVRTVRADTPVGAAPGQTRKLVRVVKAKKG